MIRKAKFENFKGLRDVEITFESRFTVLVGPNGSGKTSVLQGVEIGCWPRHASDWEVFLRNSRSDDTNQSLAIQLLDGTRNGWRIEFPSPPKANQGITSIPLVNGERTSREKADQIQLVPFAPAFRPKLDSREIALPSGTNDSPPQVGTSGRGLPALLAYMKLRDDEIFDRIQLYLTELIPSVRKLRIDEHPAANGGVSQKTLLFDTILRRFVPAEQMSDGTLYILALIVAVLGPHRPKTLLLDDIDMRLHPKAQYELVTLLKKFLDEFPDLQIIATSHSPYILDRLEANEVLVTELAEDGSVVVAPLTAHPTYPKWSESMTPGEFWSHTGEGWVKQLTREPAAS